MEDEVVRASQGQGVADQKENFEQDGYLAPALFAWAVDQPH